MNKEAEVMEKIVKVLDDKKARDLVAIEITEVTILADYFVIATGTSNTHIKALADDVEDALSKAGTPPNGVEGRATGWILIDFGSVIVHLFLPDTRSYYNLERLWADANKLDISGLLTD
ncbi:MAG: ribosome silencing factor [Oscillospiraceae bacterium]|jgi:ribosome-associated protein|nr:ribosome silencing factor [Oscillospiraceae bacterium]